MVNALSINMAVVFATFLIMGSGARSIFDNSNNELSAFRRVVFESMLNNLLLKRSTPGVTEMLNYLKAHREDPLIARLGEDLIKIGTDADKYLDTGSSSAYDDLGKTLEEYAGFLKSEPSLEEFANKFYGSLGK